jgi:hypothetical protein
MAAFKEQLSPDLIDFIAKQPVFFTGSAAATGRVNVSPKGIDCFRVFDPKRVGYLDLTGSGNETSAHVRAAKRLTIMFCSFGEKPLILRLYGTGEIVRPDDAQWPLLAPAFPSLPGTRQIVLLNIESVQTSCGFAVPKMDFVEHRPTLIDWARDRGPDAVREYQLKKNRVSIDGLETGLR